MRLQLTDDEEDLLIAVAERGEEALASDAGYFGDVDPEYLAAVEALMNKVRDRHRDTTRESPSSVPRFEKVMTLDERKARIDALNVQIAAMVPPLRTELQELIVTCPHRIVCRGCGEAAISTACTGSPLGHDEAICNVCGKEFEWFCPKSPDHICHYHSYPRQDGLYVRLLCGREHLLPSYHDYREESHNSCIFCGEPDERK